MRILFKLFTIILLFSCNKKEDSQEQITNDCNIRRIYTEEIQKITIVQEDGFFGLDNALQELLNKKPLVDQVMQHLNGF